MTSKIQKVAGKTAANFANSLEICIFWENRVNVTPLHKPYHNFPSHVIISIPSLSNMMNVATKVMYYEQRQRTSV